MHFPRATVWSIGLVSLSVWAAGFAMTGDVSGGTDDFTVRLRLTRPENIPEVRREEDNRVVINISVKPESPLAFSYKAEPADHLSFCILEVGGDVRSAAVREGGASTFNRLNMANSSWTLQKPTGDIKIDIGEGGMLAIVCTQEHWSFLSFRTIQEHSRRYVYLMNRPVENSDTDGDTFSSASSSSEESSSSSSSSSESSSSETWTYSEWSSSSSEQSSEEWSSSSEDDGTWMPSSASSIRPSSSSAFSSLRMSSSQMFSRMSSLRPSSHSAALPPPWLSSRPPGPPPIQTPHDNSSEAHNQDDREDDEMPPVTTGQRPQGPGCFAQDGTWITDRLLCAKEQRDLIERMRAEREAEAQDGIIRTNLPEEARQVLDTIPVRELREEEEAAVRERMREKFLEEERLRKRKAEIVATMREAAKRIEAAASASPSPDAQVYLTQAGTWYTSAAAFAEQEGVTWESLSELTEAGKKVGNDAQHVVTLFKPAAPKPPTGLLERMDRILDVFPEAIALATARGAAPDVTIWKYHEEAVLALKDIWPRCEADPKTCPELDRVLSPLEQASALLKQAVEQRADLSLRQEIEALLQPRQ